MFELFQFEIFHVQHFHLCVYMQALLFKITIQLL